MQGEQDHGSAMGQPGLQACVTPACVERSCQSQPGWACSGREYRAKLQIAARHC